MVEYLFLDLDDTILDFQKAEKIALEKTLRHFGIVPTDAVCSLYSRINRQHWERLEKKELTRPQVLTGRFETLFRQLQVQGDAAGIAWVYEENLSQGHYFLLGAEEALKSLSRNYELYLASNGTAHVQAGRIRSAGIAPYFKKIFVSEEIGADKPSREYFERCFAEIPGFCRERAMIVGDSLTSDILGGQNAGIRTCWVNPGRKPRREGIRVDWEIPSLSQLEDLLKTLN